jgi:hypothetical protein
MINIKEISVFNNKYSFKYVLNRLFILRHLLFSSLFVFYFIYSYMNLNIDFKEIYKIFELIYSREIMFMDYLNNKFGLDIYYIDNTNNTNYATNDNNDGTEDMQDVVNNDGTENMQNVVNNNSSNNNDNNTQTNNNQVNNAPSPVILINEPTLIDPDRVVSASEESADDDDLGDSSSGDESDNPEFSKTSMLLQEAKAAKNDRKVVARDLIEEHNDAVIDAQNNLNRNGTLSDGVQRVLIPNPNKRSREEGSDDGADDYILADRPIKRARFRDEASKQEYLKDLARAEEKKMNTAKTLNRIEKDEEKIQNIIKSKQSKKKGNDN